MKRSIQGCLFGSVIAAILLVSVLYVAFGRDLIQDHACWAAYSGDLQGSRIAEAFGARLDRGGTIRDSPIIQAAWAGQTEIIRYLLGHRISLEIKDSMDGTALSRAAQMGHVKTVEYLLKMRADVNVQDAEGGNTPIDLCRMNADQVGSEESRRNAVLVEAMITAYGGKAKTTQK